jgi:hypothetical protein
MSNPVAVPRRGYDQRIMRQQQSTEPPRDLLISSVEATRYRFIQGNYAKPRWIVPDKPILTSGTDIIEDMMMRARILASLPNVSFTVATDLNKIKEDIMPMDPPNRSETQAILDDSDIISALERSDRQYREGRAKSLQDLIKDLGFEVDALRD